LQSPEHNVKPTQRYFLVLCRKYLKTTPLICSFWFCKSYTDPTSIDAFGHIIAALTCLIFVQCVTEWVVRDHIVTVTSAARHPFVPPETGLAASIYGEYKIHVYPLLKNFTHVDSAFLTGPFSSGFMSPIASRTNTAIEYGSRGWDYLFTHVPLLMTTLKVFDLPSLVAQHHHDMCHDLCADGMECLLSHDPMRFQSLGRWIFFPYLAGIALYYTFIAVPLAGSLFGTWLAVSLNVFKCQCDLAFSSLQIQHYKNFVKLHIKEDGELEIFAIGLQKVPTKWVKDPAWEGNYPNRKRSTIRPSWSLQRPSKWIPMKDSNRHEPQIIDYCCIPKRRMK